MLERPVLPVGDSGSGGTGGTGGGVANSAGIAKSVDQTETVTMRYLTLRDQVVLSCEVRNGGSQEAKEAVLELPYDAQVIKFGDKVFSPSPDTKSLVSLGTIRPGSTVRLVVWGDSLIFARGSGDTYSLSFAGGVGSVALPVMSYAVIRAIAEILNSFADQPVLSSMLLLLFAVLCVFIFTLIRAYAGLPHQVTYEVQQRTDPESPEHPTTSANVPVKRTSLVGAKNTKRRKRGAGDQVLGSGLGK